MDDPILESWNANASNWIATIDNNEIESRTLVTNQAIVNAIVPYRPHSVLDVGCGEGWLTRTLQSHGIAAHGMDAVETLIANAIEKGGTHYTTSSYEAFISGNHQLLQNVDAAVFNFSLLDQQLTNSVLVYLAKAMHKGAYIFIQTLHPIHIAINDTYETGWKEGSWNGLKQDFTQSYQWYFRTIEDWVKLFLHAGLNIKEIKEPIHPHTKKPASMLFVLSI